MIEKRQKKGQNRKGAVDLEEEDEGGTRMIRVSWRRNDDLCYIYRNTGLSSDNCSSQVSRMRIICEADTGKSKREGQKF